MKQLVFIEDSPVSGRQHSVQPGTTVGRTDCDIVLPDPDVSRRHAIVREAGDSLAIEDLGSTNGTFVNGQRISGVTKLGEGATVRFGNTVWRLQTPADATRIVTSAEAIHASAAPSQSEAPPAPPAEPARLATSAEGNGAAQTGQQTAAPAPRQTAAQAAAPASAPGPPTPPARAAEPPAGGPDGRRGDVPAPDRVPSTIRPVLPPPGEPAPFSVPAPTRRRGSAARRVEATIVCFATVLATAVAVAVYFIER